MVGHPPWPVIVTQASIVSASTSGRSSRSTLTLTNRSFISDAVVVVGERLVLHHVAPVTRAVADGHEERATALPRPGKRLVPPRVPVDRVAGVLEEVRAGRLGEPVHPRTVRTSRTSVCIVRRQASGRSVARRFLIHSTENATVNAIASPTSTPFHGCSSNCLPPTYPSIVA